MPQHTHASGLILLLVLPFLLIDFRERIVRGEVSLEELAETESDCSSAVKGGDLGFFGPGQMQSEFTDVIYWIAKFGNKLSIDR